MMHVSTSLRGNRFGGLGRLLAVVLAVVAGALAGPPAAVAQANAADSPVKVRAVARYPKVAQGGEVVVAVEMDFGTEYHAWPAKGVKLPQDVEDFAIRTELGWPKDKKGKPVMPGWAGSLAEVKYPEARTHKVADPMGGAAKIEVPLYDKKSVIYARVAVKGDATEGEHKLDLALTYQACNDEMCLPPEDVTLPLKVTVVAKGTAEVGAENEPKLFEGFKPSASITPAEDKGKDGKDAGGKKAEGGDPKRGDAAAGPGANGDDAGPTSGPSIFGVSLAQNFFALFLAAAVGGFVLNLTPCVLPVIPIKVQTLTQHATSKGHALVLGMWMAFGVLAFWTVIGLPMAFVSARLDPSQFIFGRWWLTLGIGLVIALLGLGIMGMFTLNLPQSVYMVETKADTASGSFMFGVLTGVLGLPCFGFVAGGMLAAAATMPSWAIMTVFLGLGAGMAAPYLVLSVRPELLKFVPKTGPASDLVKQVMGMLLLAAAAFYVAAGIKGLVSEKPYVVASLQWWAVVFFILVACVWLIIRVLSVARTRVMKLAMPALAVGLSAMAVALASSQMTSDRENYLAKKEAMATAAPGEVPAGIWVDYTPELLASVRASGRPVFLDFTADWCLTCKALKRGILDREPLKTAFKERGVVIMEVDCTSNGGEGSKLLGQYGRTGVPAWAVYCAAAAEPTFLAVDRPTASTVLKGLDECPAKASATAGALVGWKPYSREAVGEAVASDKVVLVCFTAEWCTNTKGLARAVLAIDPVRDQVTSGAVLAFEADVTPLGAPAWDDLQHIGGRGVPALAVYGPAVKDPIVLTAYTSDAIMSAIEKARGKATAASARAD